MLEKAFKSLINEKNDESKNFDWHEIASLLVAQVDEVSNKKNGDLVITVFEWQNYLSALFGYGHEEASKILLRIDRLLKTKFKSVCISYLGIDKISLITESPDIKKHQADLESFFEECLKLGASLSPSPIYLDFRTGYTQLADDSKKAVDEALIALGEAKLSYVCHNIGYGQELEAIKERHNQMQLAAYLLEALYNNRLRLAFQPIISAKTGEVESYEALLRILTKEGHIISAGIFIPAAEKLGFISNIDFFVLKSVVNELNLDKDVRIAMNVSNHIVRDKNWYKEAKTLLKDKSIASRLVIEITETGGEQDLVCIGKFVENMQALGCEVAIDDFGAGCTSFKQLKLLSANILKIDGAFVRDIVENPESKIFINIMLEFARAYNLKTVAEFVETGEIAKALMELGVDYLQGFYFSQALNYRPWVKDDIII